MFCDLVYLIMYVVISFVLFSLFIVVIGFVGIVVWYKLCDLLFVVLKDVYIMNNL